MEDFVHKANIRHFRKLLVEESDPEKRKTIKALLAEELAKGQSKVRTEDNEG
jgi:hypothetical protein